MDACLSVEKEVNKVLSKFGSINDHASKVLGDLITYVKNLHQELQNAPEDYVLTNLQVDLIKQAMAKIKETVSRLATDHRDLHSSVSKVGKAIDRNFAGDFTATSKADIFEDPEKIKLINTVICQHLYQSGMEDVAEELQKEAGIKVSYPEKEDFVELNHILDCLKNRNLEPALAWAINKHDVLLANHSVLEFKLHRLKFIELLSKGASHQTEAINYARMYFGRFVKKHEQEIQVLMGMLLYVPNGISTSPYGGLLNDELWLDIYELFLIDSCKIAGISVHSHLSTCISAGCIAIPALLNIKQVMKERQVIGVWNGKDELPIEIDLGTSGGGYHSMFACPILRQQATQSNPPMRLVCGHVISKDALNKLCGLHKYEYKMKCPYCPVDQKPSDARLVYF